MIEFEKVHDHKYQVHTRSGLDIGVFLQDEDGYFYYWPETQGCWSASKMRIIADKLDELNKPIRLN
jgi:hypothetical protein